MEQSKIDRINELARKNRAGGLTENELKEREAQLDNTYIVDGKGNKTKLRRKEGK